MQIMPAKGRCHWKWYVNSKPCQSRFSLKKFTGANTSFNVRCYHHNFDTSPGDADCESYNGTTEFNVYHVNQKYDRSPFVGEILPSSVSAPFDPADVRIHVNDHGKSSRRVDARNSKEEHTSCASQVNSNDPHFKPSYVPWSQRICLCPDGDFFEA
jgi:hypothetical protein